ncbi:MAG: hypothetical protein ACAI43_02335 [Phycisphaerae bacterium]|nr:hypothetical protein [Tepidisphaeraceae bacterium]
MKRLMTIAAVVLAFGLMAGNAEAAKGDKAAKKAGGKGAGVAGTVVKVDGNNVVLSAKGKAAGEVIVATDASTEVLVNGAKGALADIKPGMKVQASPAVGTAKTVTAGAGGKGDKAAKKAKKAKKAK